MRLGRLQQSTGCGCVGMHTSLTLALHVIKRSRRCGASCHPDMCMRRPRTLAALAPKPHAVLGQEVLTDALWTVSYVSDGTERYIQAVLASRPIRRQQLAKQSRCRPLISQCFDSWRRCFAPAEADTSSIPFITRCHMPDIIH